MNQKKKKGFPLLTVLNTKFKNKLIIKDFRLQLKKITPNMQGIKSVLIMLKYLLPVELVLKAK